MKNKKRPVVYLASQSARRKQLLEKCGVRFKVVPSAYHERLIPKLSPSELVLAHAAGKVVKAKIPRHARFVLGADTVVVFKGKILGKPKNRKSAVHMLSAMAGKRHEVYTGVAFFDRRTLRWATGVSKTKVYLRRMSRADVNAYFDQVNPMDKAGAYGIQEGPKIVRKIDGSYTNVVGMPMDIVKKMLTKMIG